MSVRSQKISKISRYSQVLEMPCLQHSARFTDSALLFLVQQPQLLQLLVYLQPLPFLSTAFSCLVVRLCCSLLTLENKPLSLLLMYTMIQATGWTRWLRMANGCGHGAPIVSAECNQVARASCHDSLPSRTDHDLISSLSTNSKL